MSYDVEFLTEAKKKVTVCFTTKYEQEEFVAKYNFVKRLVEEANGKLIVEEEQS